MWSWPLPGFRFPNLLGAKKALALMVKGAVPIPEPQKLSFCQGSGASLGEDGHCFAPQVNGNHNACPNCHDTVGA